MWVQIKFWYCNPFKLYCVSNLLQTISFLFLKDIWLFKWTLQLIYFKLYFEQALWKTLRNPVDNIAHVAFRVLGKFGGGNRKMLREPQRVSIQQTNNYVFFPFTPGISIIVYFDLSFTHIYRIMVVVKVDTDIITSIEAHPIDQL